MAPAPLPGFCHFAVAFNPTYICPLHNITSPSPPRRLITFPSKRAPVLDWSCKFPASPSVLGRMSFRTSNASSGMGVADHCKHTYLELQRKKVHRYVIFKIDEKKEEVIVEKTGGAAETYGDFRASLPENDCRYAIYDFDFVTEENCRKSKIFFIAWSPSISQIRAKMLYATSKYRFRRGLDGIHYEIQATDPPELDIEVLRERAS